MHVLSKVLRTGMAINIQRAADGLRKHRLVLSVQLQFSEFRELRLLHLTLVLFNKTLWLCSATCELQNPRLF